MVKNIPDGEIIARERKRHGLTLFCIEGDGVKPLEDRRGLAGRRGVVNVELRDLREQGTSTKGA